MKRDGHRVSARLLALAAVSSHVPFEASDFHRRCGANEGGRLTPAPALTRVRFVWVCYASDAKISKRRHVMT